MRPSGTVPIRVPAPFAGSPGGRSEVSLQLDDRTRSSGHTPLMRDLFLSRVPRAALPVLCVVIAASGACSGSHTADDPAPVDGGRSDAASRDLNTARDLPVIDTDGGGSEVCGSTVCRPGQVCCNESCGICAAEGESCPAIACVDAGGPCVGCAPPPEGCRYVGGTCETCGELVCEDTSCGGFVGRMCGAEEYCNYAEGCGFDDGGGTCAPRPQACDPRLPRSVRVRRKELLQRM